MYSILTPTADEIEAYRLSQIVRPVFQSDGEIPDPPPLGFHSNRGSDVVGTGEADFHAAVDALRCWKMFPGGWVRVEAGGEQLHLGQTVAVVARCCGLWSVNCCRVVDVTSTDRSFAFTYATTDQHAFEGAERFWVEWRCDDSVWFVLHSIARPRDLVVRIALPLLKRRQRRFLAESPIAVRRVVARRASVDRQDDNDSTLKSHRV